MAFALLELREQLFRAAGSATKATCPADAATTDSGVEPEAS